MNRKTPASHQSSRTFFIFFQKYRNGQRPLFFTVKVHGTQLFTKAIDQVVEEHMAIVSALNAATCVPKISKSINLLEVKLKFVRDQRLSIAPFALPLLSLQNKCSQHFEYTYTFLSRFILPFETKSSFALAYVV